MAGGPAALRHAMESVEAPVLELTPPLQMLHARVEARFTTTDPSLG